MVDVLVLDRCSDQSPTVPWFNRMWASVIRRAAVDWVLYRSHPSPKLRQLGEEAGAWLFDGPEEPQDATGVFASVCQSLNIEMAEMRNRIRAISEADARKLRGLEFDDEDL